MQRFQNILVGVDLLHAEELTTEGLNSPSQEAISRAHWLAEQTSARITFFSAFDADIPQDSDGTANPLIAAVESVLTELVHNAKQRGISAQSKLTFDKDWMAIVRQVLRDQHDLVIIGTRDRGATQRVLFGSTAMNLLRNCPCPVWVTKPDPIPEDLNILVCSDLSPVSRTALDIVISGGQFLDAKVHLLHAVDYPFDRPLQRTGMAPADVDAYRRKIRGAAEEELNHQLVGTDYRTMTFGVMVHVVDGPAELAIVRAIEEHEIDLLVMGTVARSGIPGLLIGNTAERLLPDVPCSILAIKPDDFETPVTLE